MYYSAVHKKIEQITLSAFFITIIIILNKFVAFVIPIQGVNMIRLGFGGVMMILASLIMGVKFGVIIAIISDLVGHFLFPQGTFNIGYTIDAGLIGLIPGLMVFFFKNIDKTKRIFPVAAFIANTFISGILLIFLLLNDAIMVPNSGSKSIDLTSYSYRLFFILILLGIYLITSFLIVFFAFKKRSDIIFIILVVLSCEMLVTIPLNPLWTALFYSHDYSKLLLNYQIFLIPKTLFAILVMPVKIPVLYVLYRTLDKLINKREQN